MGIGDTYTRLPLTEVSELFLNDLGTTTDDKLFLRQSLARRTVIAILQRVRVSSSCMAAQGSILKTVP
jgi:hypothetical protein